MQKAKKIVITLLSVTIGLVVGLSVQAETLRTEVIKPEVGFSLKQSGLMVEKVTEINGEVKIEMSLPKKEQTEIEEVLVVGTQNKPVLGKLEKGILTKVEVVNDLDKDRSGIVVYFGKRQTFVLKINYYEPVNL